MTREADREDAARAAWSRGKICIIFRQKTCPKTLSGARLFVREHFNSAELLIGMLSTPDSQKNRILEGRREDSHCNLLMVPLLASFLFLFCGRSIDPDDVQRVWRNTNVAFLMPRLYEQLMERGEKDSGKP
jgi:hypothetical protein